MCYVYYASRDMVQEQRTVMTIKGLMHVLCVLCQSRYGAGTPNSYDYYNSSKFSCLVTIFCVFYDENFISLISDRIQYIILPKYNMSGGYR